MRFRAPLDDLIHGQTSVRVLRVLSLFPEKRFTGRELAGAARAPPSKVIQELERFRHLGLVSRTTHGRAHVWRANRGHALLRILAPAFEEERGLPAAFVDELVRGVDDPRVSRAVLFGSFARGAETPESDVDLLVIVRRAADRDLVRKRLDLLSRRLAEVFGLQLSPIVHSESELPRLRKTSLASSIRAEGRVLRGAPL